MGGPEEAAGSREAARQRPQPVCLPGKLALTLLGMRPGASSLTFLCLSFLICKLMTAVPTSTAGVRVVWVRQAPCLEQSLARPKS